MITTLVEDRLRAKAVEIDGHLIWCGVSNPAGYGKTTLRGNSTSTHRAMWEQVYGPIPAGLFVLHTCDTPPCIQPEHLYLGTRQNNSDDMRRRMGYEARDVTLNLLLTGTFTQDFEVEAISSTKRSHMVRRVAR